MLCNISKILILSGSNALYNFRIIYVCDNWTQTRIITESGNINRNQKIFTTMTLWKQFLPKQTGTNCTSFVILTWWAHYIFKDNTFIQYPDSRLAFSPDSKRARVASGDDHNARLCELLYPEDWHEQVMATSVISFFSFW